MPLGVVQRLERLVTDTTLELFLLPLRLRRVGRDELNLDLWDWWWINGCRDLGHLDDLHRRSWLGTGRQIPLAFFRGCLGALCRYLSHLDNLHRGCWLGTGR